MPRTEATPTPRWRAARPDHQLPPGRGESARGPAPDDGSGPGLGTLLRSLGEDMGTLVRQEIRLAKAEAGHTARRVAADSAWIGAGAVIAAVGGVCLVVALALGLGALLDSYWLGTLITGALLVLIGAIAAWKGVRDLQRGEFAPTRTVETLRDDAEWARREALDLKEELTKKEQG